MSLNISFDYRFDSSGFFSDPAVRAALEAAGAAWGALIQDDFQTVATGTRFEIENPSILGQTEEITLTSPIDDLLIFVGTRSLWGPLAIGGYDGVSAEGDVFYARIASDFRDTGPVTDFEPWAGTIVFDPNKDWSFDPAGPGAGGLDFQSVAMHEIGHVLGLGTAPIFNALGAGGLMDSPNALAVTGGAGIPLEADTAHIDGDFAGGTDLMDPTVVRGQRLTPSTYDLAMLADIGYEIAGMTKQGSAPALTTEGDDPSVWGSILADYFDGLGGDDWIQGHDGADTIIGGAGNDTLYGQTGDDLMMGGTGDDVISGGAGDDILRNGAGTDTLYGGAGTDVFEIRANGPTARAVLYDFDQTTEVIRLIGSDFASAAAAAAAVTKPYTNVARLVLADGTSVDAYLDGPSQTTLTAANFEVISAVALTGGAGADRLEGGDGPDSLDGFGGNDWISGGLGDDTLSGGTGADTLIGGGGNDVLYGGEDAGDLRDVIYGGDGNDRIDGGYGNDDLRGDAGNDTLSGGFGADTVIGGAGNDDLTGAAYGDLIFGGDGDDFINGGFGFDRVNGGAGADRFYHLGLRDHGSDWIQDYNAAEGDVLQFGGAADTAASDFLVQRSFTANAGAAVVQEVFVTQISTGTLLWALVDGDAQAHINIQIGSGVFDLLA